MKNNSTINVVIPCRDSVDNLTKTLNSLLSQSHCPSAVVIVDDGSRVPLSESSEPVKGFIERFSKKGVSLKLIGFETSKGPAAARNAGAAACDTEVILFIDADVVVMPMAIQRILTAFTEDPDLSSVQGVYTSDTPEGSSVPTRYQNHYYHFAFKSVEGRYPAICATYCFAIRRTVFNEIGGFDDSIHCPTVEDEAFGYTLTARGHKILLHRSVQVTHLASYTYDRFILRKFRMSFNQIKSLLRGNTPPVFGRNNKNDTHHSKDVLAAVMFSPLLLLSWLVTWPAGFLASLIYTGLNARFWSYLTRNEPAIYFIEMFFLTWIDQVTIFTGMVVGTLDYFLGRKV